MTATIVAAVVGTTRIYLRVHWLSDVLGGLGPGRGVFATCGIVALVVGFVRDNPDADAPADATSSNETLDHLRRSPGPAACSASPPRSG